MSLLSRWFKKRETSRRRPLVRSRRPGIESLEARTLLATSPLSLPSLPGSALDATAGHLGSELLVLGSDPSRPVGETLGGTLAQGAKVLRLESFSFGVHSSARGSESQGVGAGIASNLLDVTTAGFALTQQDARSIVTATLFQVDAFKQVVARWDFHLAKVVSEQVSDQGSGIVEEIQFQFSSVEEQFTQSTKKAGPDSAALPARGLQLESFSFNPSLAQTAGVQSNSAGSVVVQTASDLAPEVLRALEQGTSFTQVTLPVPQQGSGTSSSLVGKGPAASGEELTFPD
jgi:hypothetical protein